MVKVLQTIEVKSAHGGHGGRGAKVYGYLTPKKKEPEKKKEDKSDKG